MKGDEDDGFAPSWRLLPPCCWAGAVPTTLTERRRSGSSRILRVRPLRRDHDGMDDVQTLNAELQEQLDPTSLDDVKDTTLAFLDDVIAATDRMLSDVQAAGVPDVTDGGEALGGCRRRSATSGTRWPAPGIASRGSRTTTRRRSGRSSRRSARIQESSTRTGTLESSRSRARGGRRRRPGVRPARGVSLPLGGRGSRPYTRRDNSIRGVLASSRAVNAWEKRAEISGVS